MQTLAFKPQGATQAITTGAASANAEIGSNGGNQVLIHNAGTTIAFVKFGSGSGTVATSAGTPVPPGAVIILTKNPASDYVAALGTATAGTVYAQVGEGV